MRLRYRILSREFDPDAYAAQVKDELTARLGREPTALDFLPGGPPNWVSRPERRGAVVADVVVGGLVSAPDRVIVEEEGEATIEELRSMIRAERLKAGDLVADGDVWTTAAQSPLLLEHFEEYEQATSLGTGTVVVLLLVVLAVLAVAVLVIG